jgi:hypothetical protein
MKIISNHSSLPQEPLRSSKSGDKDLVGDFFLPPSSPSSTKLRERQTDLVVTHLPTLPGMAFERVQGISSNSFQALTVLLDVVAMQDRAPLPKSPVVQTQLVKLLTWVLLEICAMRAKRE